MKESRNLMLIMWSLMMLAFLFYWILLYTSSHSLAGEGTKMLFLLLCVGSTFSLPVYAIAEIICLIKSLRIIFNWISLATYIPAALWLYYYSSHPDHFNFWGSIID